MAEGAGQRMLRPRDAIGTVHRWPARRWWTALATSAFTLVFIAIPTDLIDTPFFGREVPPTAWAWPVLIVSAVLAGLVTATYVAYPDGAAPRRAEGRLGMARPLPGVG